MDKFSLLMDFIGSMEPSTWVSMSGIKAGPYSVLVVCCYTVFRYGMANGMARIFGYAMSLAALLFTFSLL